MVKKRFSKKQKEIITELQNGAYILYDGVNCELKNSKIICQTNTFQKLLEHGAVIDVDYYPSYLDEKKYILSKEFNQ